MSKYTLKRPSRIPISVWIAVIVAAILGRKRSPAKDGDHVWQSIEPPVALSGEDRLPVLGPYVVVGNHLNGPGIWVGLSAALIAAAIGRRAPGIAIRGVGVSAYRDFKLWSRIRIPDGFTEFLFRRFYAVYDIIRMPHVTEGAGPRSGAVRRILAGLKRGDIVILFPEGGNVSDFRMNPIQPGVGDLLRLLAKSGVGILPVAVAPVGTTFSVNIGMQIQILPQWDRAEVEAVTGRAIAIMLPEELRGPFA
jgi:1-acyl-sn-glycerol-3-phosphate acyltransferase